MCCLLKHLKHSLCSFTKLCLSFTSSLVYLKHFSVLCFLLQNPQEKLPLLELLLLTWSAVALPTPPFLLVTVLAGSGFCGSSRPKAPKDFDLSLLPISFSKKSMRWSKSSSFPSLSRDHSNTMSSGTLERMIGTRMTPNFFEVTSKLARARM